MCATLINKHLTGTMDLAIHPMFLSGQEREENRKKKRWRETGRERGTQIRGFEVQGMRQSADADACKLEGE